MPDATHCMGQGRKVQTAQESPYSGVGHNKAQSKMGKRHGSCHGARIGYQNGYVSGVYFTKQHRSPLAVCHFPPRNLSFH
ncbi:hypothetical protein TIFTF001_005017 [Ficus carica]|uniref:Uncharacterized protein n=1 Tax=Ficus carica TaxID=3494 RepID=A0AA87ZJC9_FICCA|nr:hypothetical protein TIFTF001_005017 [Ficus carica]